MRNIPITQSRLWQNLQEDLNTPSFYEETKDYTYLAIEKRTPVGNYLYLPYGPVAESSESLEKALASLTGLAKAQQAMHIRIEPQSPAAASILRQKAINISGTILQIRKSRDLSPAETWVLDLESTDDYQSLCPSRLLRYYRGREKQGLVVKTSKNPDDIHCLLDLQKQLAKEKGINTFSAEYLQTELKQPFATLYLVCRTEDFVAAEGVRSAAARGIRGRSPVATGRPNPGPRSDKISSPLTEKVLAAGLVFDDDTTRYNLQGAQSEEGKKLHATGILTIQLIKDAKEKGLQTFDFWGIAPEGAPDTHPWHGFTDFKKTFHGVEKQYQGTYDLILSPTKYKLYALLRRLHR